MGYDLILNLDDALLVGYRRAAVANGRSLETELRAALAAARPAESVLTGDALHRLAQTLWAATPPTATTDSTPTLRAIRDGE